MKRFLILSLCGALLFAGCHRKAAQKDVGEPQAESADKGNLVEMSVSAQQHIGMVVTPAAVTQLNEYPRATGTIQPIDSRIGVVGPLARGRIVEVRARLETGSKLAKRLRSSTTSKPENSSRKSSQHARISNASRRN